MRNPFRGRNGRGPRPALPALWNKPHSLGSWISLPRFHSHCFSSRTCALCLLGSFLVSRVEIPDTDRSESVKPNFRSSPWILGAPQVGFSRAIRWISSRISRVILPRPPTGPRDLQRQYNRNPARCHLTTVSGFTMRRASAQPDHKRRSAVQNSRSIGFNFGQGRLRLNTASCWRRARISNADCVRPTKKARRAGTTLLRSDQSISLKSYHRAGPYRCASGR